MVPAKATPCKGFPCPFTHPPWQCDMIYAVPDCEVLSLVFRGIGNLPSIAGQVAFYNRWYRFRLWHRDYFRARDLLNLLAALLMGVVATLAYSTHPSLTVFLGTCYVVIVAVLFVITALC